MGVGKTYINTIHPLVINVNIASRRGKLDIREATCYEYIAYVRCNDPLQPNQTTRCIVGKTIAIVFCFLFVTLTLVAGDASATACAEQTCHIVQKGDSLTKIARHYGMGANALMNANPEIKNRNLIKIGWAIRVPGQAQKQAKMEDVGSVKGLERPDSQPASASNFSASSPDALKNEMSELRKDIASLTRVQAETSVELKRAYQEIARLKLENENLRREQPQRTSAMSVLTGGYTSINQESPLVVTGLLCASGIIFLLVQFKRDSDMILRERTPRKSSPAGKDKIPALYKKAKLTGGNPPWEVDITRVRDPTTLLTIKENPSLFKKQSG